MATGPDIQRMVGDLGRFGSVVSVDHAAGTCRVQIGDILSGDLPWLEYAAGETRTYCPPSKGEQVFVFSPEADLACGFVVGSMFSDANPAPSADQTAVCIKFGDGAYIAYDCALHELVAVLPTGGKALIEAPGGITLRGDVTVEGKVTATGDVVGDGVSLKNHRHGQVQAGGAISGKPVA